MLVKQCMSQPVITVKPDHSVIDVCELFETYDIHRVPVINSSNLMGIISDQDVRTTLPSSFEISKGSTAWKHYQKIMAAEVMSSPVFTINVNDNIDRAGSIMQEKKIGGLPVVDGNKTVGMVTEHDLFQAMLEMTGTNWEISDLVVYYNGKNGGIRTITNEIKKYPARILSLAINRRIDSKKRNKATVRIHTGFISDIATALQKKYDDIYFHKI